MIRHCVPIFLPLRSPGVEARDDVGFGDAERLRGLGRTDELGQRRGGGGGGRRWRGLRRDAARLVQHLLRDRRADRQLGAEAANAGPPFSRPCAIWNFT